MPRDSSSDQLRHAYEDVKSELARTREELVYWRQTAVSTSGSRDPSSGSSLEGFNVGLMRVDSTGAIVLVNSTFCQYLEVSREELEGKPVQTLRNHFSQEVVDLFRTPTEAPMITEVADDSRNTVLEFKTTWKKGSVDVVIQDISSESRFKNQIERYLSPNMGEVTEDDLYTFRYPDRRYMTVSFTDLRGFTNLMDKMSPEEIRATLNSYLECVINTAEELNGSVVKILGDVVMIVFGAPRYYQDHPLRAIKTACEQVRRMEILRNKLVQMGQDMPACGVGINTGDMVVGNIGSSSHQDYTVVGSSVNVAQRICDLARGGETLITHSTLEAVMQNLPDYWEVLETTHQDESPLPPAGRGEGIYLLPDSLQNKMVLLGPAVSSAPENAELILRYLYSIQVKGSPDPIPVVSVEAPTSIDAIPLNNSKVIETKAERTLGKYRLTERIGRGGMGEIWKGRDSFGNNVAIKTLIAGEAATERQILRFQREAETMGRLAHRSIVRILEVGEIDQVRFIAMEFVDGVNLANLLSYGSEQDFTPARYKSKVGDLATMVKSVFKKMKDSGEAGGETLERRDGRFRILPEHITIEIGLTICSAVHYAHLHKILHRDLKPANIMIRTDGEPLVTDFGLAKIHDVDRQEASVSMSGQLIGTIEYMAPEQARDTSELTSSADVYSIGAILYQMITGRKHFQTTGNILNDIQNLQDHIPPRPRTYNPQVDSDLEAIIMKALNPDPAQRYRGVAGLRSDLDRYRNGEVVGAVNLALWAMIWRRIKRHKSITAVVIVSVLMLSLSIGFYLWQARQSSMREQALRMRAEAALQQEATARLELEDALKREKQARQDALKNFNQLVTTRKQVQATQDKYTQLEDQTKKTSQALADVLLKDADEAMRERKVWLAIEHANRATEQAPLYAEPWRKLGIYLESVRRYQPAIEAFQKGLELLPKDAHLQASIQRVKGLIEHSQTFLGRYEKKKTPSQDDHAQAGNIYFEKKRYKEAEKAFLKAVTKPCPYNAELDARRLMSRFRQIEPAFNPSLSNFKTVNNRITEIDLKRAGISKVPSLSGLRLQALLLDDTKVSDLEFLEGCRVNSLSISGTPVESLESIAGIALVRLFAGRTKIKDISPLPKLSKTLRFLDLQEIPCKDFSPLKGLELDVLDASGTAFDDMKLLGATSLQVLKLRKSLVSRIAFVPGFRASNLDLSSTRIESVEALAGLPIHHLKINGTRVKDLSPLAYNVMYSLQAADTPITSIAPLRNMPLSMLNILHTRVRDLTPLETTPLQEIRFSPGRITKGIDVLRSKASIQQIGEEELMSPEEFWKAYDAGRFKAD